MKKIGLFLDEIKNQGITDSEKFAKLGFNTGNMLFWYALKRGLDLDIKSRWFIDNPAQLNLGDYKAFITTDLIWIRQNQDFSYLNRTLDMLKGIPLVPISIGLQCNDWLTDFEFHPETLKVLRRISERCVMGVRGSYTAEILGKHGIKNFRIIGCPSMYMDTQGMISVNNNPKKIERVTSNFETFYQKLDLKRIEFLEYGAEKRFSFVEQAQAVLEEKNISDPGMLLKVKSWIEGNGKCFFDINSWRRYMEKFDFSLGLRFHGNVLALWEGVPALFVTCDSRTKELCEFYALPSIDIRDFDKSKPIEYYYERADYNAFHGIMKRKKEEYLNFLLENKLSDNTMVKTNLEYDGADVRDNDTRLNKRKKCLYHVGHMGSFISAILHKILYHSKDEAVFILDCVIANSSYVKFVEDNKDDLSIYGKIILRNEREILDFAGTVQDLEKCTVQFFDRLLSENDININDIGNIYALFDTFNAFGVYLSLKNVTYKMIESFKGQCGNHNRYGLNGRKEYDALLLKYLALSGDSPNVTEVLSYENYSQYEIVNQLDTGTICKLVETFGGTNLEFSSRPYAEFVFSSAWIASQLSAESDKVVSLYFYLHQLIFDYLCDKNYRMLIKPHPNSDYPGLWHKYFENAEVLPGHFPSILVPYIPRIRIDKVYSTGSTGADINDKKMEYIPFNIFYYYDLMHKLYFMLDILQWLKMDQLYSTGIKIEVMKCFARKFAIENVEEINLNTIVEGKAVAICCCKNVVDIEEARLKEYIASSSESVFFFLDPPDVQFFMNLNIDLAKIITINIKKTIIKDNCFDNGYDEYIYLYTKKDSVFHHLQGYNTSICLDNCGMELTAYKSSNFLTMDRKRLEADRLKKEIELWKNKYMNVADNFIRSADIADKLIYTVKLVNKLEISCEQISHYGIDNTVIWGILALTYGRDGFQKSTWSCNDFRPNSVTIIDNIYWNPGEYRMILTQSMTKILPENDCIIIFLNSRCDFIFSCFMENIVSVNVYGKVSGNSEECIYIFTKNCQRKSRIIDLINKMAER